MVKERRGARLKDDPDLFTGLFWTGKKGLELGLVDALGDMRTVLKDRYGAKTELRLITPAARPVRPQARHLRLLWRGSCTRYRLGRGLRPDRCGGRTRALEPLRPLKKPARAEYHRRRTHPRREEKVECPS